MRNFHVGTVMGIPIKVNITLLLFLPALAWLIAAGGQIEVYAQFIAGVSNHAFDVPTLKAGNTPWIIGSVGAVGLFASVLLHELGHSWVARRYDVEIASITLWIFGGMARMEDIPEEWDREFWIAIAGPTTSVLLGVGLLALLQVIPGTGTFAFVVGFLGIINVVLAVFNMLPAFPMDGGRIFRALLARRRSYVDATRIAATVGKGMAVLMALVGLLGNPLLILIALFVYMAASQESKATVIRELLRGVVVKDLMSQDVRTVDENESVASLVERIMLERHTGFPVVDAAERVVGAVTLDAVRPLSPDERETTSVGDVMEPDPPTVGPNDDAFQALQLFGETGGPLLVTEDDRLVGVVTQEDLVRALEVIQGIGETREPELAPEGYA